ncbi:hypothetical protein MMF93_01350 [Streptomyces tubbatahanensis]|uniref:Uncharacterized protein n=1 Tax=Streptomyces tubbatahanensis TaxID=2923272 RepID=A0ABY3XLG7_9ACTN|nr:hypothetical protein [Streptomyces tubbatahanensis]UNS95258.1 hypothetical protein MMF93_01350 [Streptomyces tubbatahanensis]
MARATREPLPGGGLVLTVPEDGTPRPPLRLERASDRRWLLRQGERPLIRARSEGDGCCRDLHLRRLPGYRSPLPHLTAARMRTSPDWPHLYARWLEEARGGPLHRGRWLLNRRATFTPGIWDCDLVRDWPEATLELLCGGGWHGVLPLRPLPAPDAARVKAYRKHAREGTLAPVLLWWVSFLDGWLLLDGHDRAAAALAEGAPPECVEVVRVADDAHWRATAEEITEAYEKRVARVAADPASRHTARHRHVVDRAYAEVLSGLPYDADTTPVFDPAPE